MRMRLVVRRELVARPRMSTVVDAMVVPRLLEVELILPDRGIRERDGCCLDAEVGGTGEVIIPLAVRAIFVAGAELLRKRFTYTSPDRFKTMYQSRLVIDTANRATKIQQKDHDAGCTWDWLRL